MSRWDRSKKQYGSRYYVGCPVAACQEWQWQTGLKTCYCKCGSRYPNQVLVWAHAAGSKMAGYVPPGIAHGTGNQPAPQSGRGKASSGKGKGGGKTAWPPLASESPADAPTPESSTPVPGEGNLLSVQDAIAFLQKHCVEGASSLVAPPVLAPPETTLPIPSDTCAEEDIRLARKHYQTCERKWRKSVLRAEVAAGALDEARTQLGQARTEHEDAAALETLCSDDFAKAAAEVAEAETKRQKEQAEGPPTRAKPKGKGKSAKATPASSDETILWSNMEETMAALAKETRLHPGTDEQNTAFSARVALLYEGLKTELEAVKARPKPEGASDGASAEGPEQGLHPAAPRTGDPVLDPTVGGTEAATRRPAAPPLDMDEPDKKKPRPGPAPELDGDETMATS